VDILAPAEVAEETPSVEVEVETPLGEVEETPSAVAVAVAVAVAEEMAEVVAVCGLAYE